MSQHTHTCPKCKAIVTIPEIPVRNTGFLRCWQCGVLFPYRKSFLTLEEE